MKDITVPTPTPDAAADLVRYLARRVATDVDLAYLISPITETHARLTRALMQVDGIGDAEARERLRRQPGLHETPRIPALRDRVGHLEALLDERCPDWRDADDAT